MAPLDQASSSLATLPSIEDVPHATHDEHARQGYVSVLRKHIMTEMAQDMRAAYDTTVAPGFKKAQGRAPKDGREVRRAMPPSAHCRF